MKTTAFWLVLASVTFWLTWMIMPGIGITDTDTIFRLVAEHRGAVFASLVVQLVSAAAFAPAIVGLMVHGGGSRLMRFGCTLLALGAMGSAADAIFHLVAYRMTAPGVDLAVVAPVMKKLQGPDLALIMPFVISLFIGHAVVAGTLARRSRLARIGFFVVLAVPVFGCLGAMISGPAAGVAVITALCGGFSLAAWTLGRPADGTVRDAAVTGRPEWSST